MTYNVKLTFKSGNTVTNHCHCEGMMLDTVRIYMQSRFIDRVEVTIA